MADSIVQTDVAMETEESEEPEYHGDEYCVQYFGFLPQSFMNGMYNAIRVYLKDAMTALNEGILQVFGNKISETELRENAQQQWEKAVKKLDEKFDKAEVYLLSNVFSLPRHVVLPEDKAQVEAPCDLEEIAALDAEIQEVTSRIIAVKLANALLHEQMREVDLLQKQLDGDLTTVDTMYQTVASQSSGMMQTVNGLRNVVTTVETLEFKCNKT